MSLYDKILTSLDTNDRPFVCDVCSKAFRFRSNLAEHRSVHTGEKNHICPHCGHLHRLKGNLTKHIAKVHSLLPKYKFCQVCDDHPAIESFGAIVCSACSTFFHRHSNNIHIPIPCIFDDHLCVINKNTRDFCSACWLEKCFNVGMKNRRVKDKKKNNQLQPVNVGPSDASKNNVPQTPILPVEQNQNVSEEENMYRILLGMCLQSGV